MSVKFLCHLYYLLTWPWCCHLRKFTLLRALEWILSYHLVTQVLKLFTQVKNSVLVFFKLLINQTNIIKLNYQAFKIFTTFASWTSSFQIWSLKNPHFFQKINWRSVKFKLSKLPQTLPKLLIFTILYMHELNKWG